MASGTGTCLVLLLVHATSLVVVSASMMLAVIIALVCSRLVSDMLLAAMFWYRCSGELVLRCSGLLVLGLSPGGSSFGARAASRARLN